jgi:DNA-directed RNA polymerase specialized sigma24 family protein
VSTTGRCHCRRVSANRDVGGFGLTDREIADQLTVSVRTVEGYVYRACINLDLADRDELAQTVRSDIDYSASLSL